MAVEVPDIVSVVAVKLAVESVLLTVIVEVTAVRFDMVTVLRVKIVLLVITCVAVELSKVEVAV